MYAFSFWQYSVNRNQHLLYRDSGIKVHAETKLVTKLIVENWCQIDFVTVNGKRISKTVKCGGEEGFLESYQNLEVIYLEENPEAFIPVFQYNQYSHAGTLFFFFGLIGCGGTFVLYRVLKNGRRRFNT